MTGASKRRGRPARRIRLTEEAGERPARESTEPASCPSLAELRRRATHRVRELAASLHEAEERYMEAAAECARLRATRLGDPQPRTVPEEAAPAVGHGDSEAAQSEAEKLRGQLGEAASRLAAERSRNRRLQDGLREVEEELVRAREALEAERARSTALEAQANHLEAQLRQLEDETVKASEDSAEAWRKRVVQLQLDLKRSLADNAQLREDLGGLLRFLDELSAVLSTPAGILT